MSFTTNPWSTKAYQGKLSDRYWIILTFLCLRELVGIFQPRYAHGLGSLQFPNGASPVVSRMCIYSGNSLLETRYQAFDSCFFFS